MISNIKINLPILLQYFLMLLRLIVLACKYNIAINTIVSDFGLTINNNLRSTKQKYNPKITTNFICLDLLEVLEIEPLIFLINISNVQYSHL